MIPRFACLLLLLCGSLSAAEEPEKHDPDRFGAPLIRAWFPATLIFQQRDFQLQIHKEMQGDEYQEPEGLFSAVKSSLLDPALREGVLVYYDPQGIDSERSESRQSDEWYDAQSDALYYASNSYNFPGYPQLKPVRFKKVESREAFELEVRRRTNIDDDEISMGTLEAKGQSFVLSDQPVSFYTPLGPMPLFGYLNRTSQYWTYRDGYMFFGNFEEILEMEFPDSRTLSPTGTDADRDIFVQVDLNAVLPRQKRILWNLIRKEFERSLQQYDDEGDAEYAFRKSVGDLQLNLIQAVTQDLESIQLGIDFAVSRRLTVSGALTASEETPAKAELELVARPRVNLERYFGTSGIGSPALAAFVEEPAVMTLATSWGLPDRIVQTLEKLQLVVDAKLAEQRGWTVDAILASEELAEDLLETIRGNNQIAVKLKQSEYGFTLYGGMRVQNAERVSKNLAIVLQGLTARDGWGVVQSRDKSGRTYFSFRPEDLTQSVTNHQRKRFPAELHFTVVDEILWFSVGREDSLDILSASLDRIKEREDQPVRSSIPLALFDMSLDGMFPDKDLNDTKGFDRLPLAMVEQLDSLIPHKQASPYRNVVTFANHAGLELVSPAKDAVYVPETKAGNQPRKEQLTELSQSIVIAREETARNYVFSLNDTIGTADAMHFTVKTYAPDPMRMKKFLQPDQSRIRIQFDADEKRVRAKATVGLGVIKHVYSRMMESQEVIPHVFRSGLLFLNDGTSSQLGGDVEYSFPAQPK